MNSLKVRLDKFDSRIGLDRGRSKVVEAIWYLFKCVFFLSPIPWPYRLKKFILVQFGAQVGIGFVIRPRVNIHMPWKLQVGNHCWIGEDCEILNLEMVAIGNHVAIAHRVYIATGNHDYKNHTMPYRNAPVNIEDGVWIGSCVFVGPGITIGQHSVISAGSVVTRSIEQWKVVAGNPALIVRDRELLR